MSHDTFDTIQMILRIIFTVVVLASATLVLLRYLESRRAAASIATSRSKGNGSRTSGFVRPGHSQLHAATDERTAVADRDGADAAAWVEIDCIGNAHVIIPGTTKQHSEIVVATIHFPRDGIDITQRNRIADLVANALGATFPVKHVRAIDLR